MTPPDATLGTRPETGKWNYRVVERGGQVGFHEVVYHADGTIQWVSAEPVAAAGGSVDELAADLQRMAEALGQPVLVFRGAAEPAGES